MLIPTRVTAFVLASLFLLAACRDAPTPPTASSTVGTTSSAISRVTAASHVCMVNDRFMGSEQIPVSVGGKTYYGCCSDCKDKLQSNPSVRTAVDPITQRPVDKAIAVIGKTDNGKVLYFESAESFARYGRE